MLILGRHIDQAILIGDDQGFNIRIVVVKVNNTGNVRLGIEAPDDVRILREELVEPNGGNNDADRTENR